MVPVSACSWAIARRSNAANIFSFRLLTIRFLYRTSYATISGAVRPPEMIMEDEGEQEDSAR